MFKVLMCVERQHQPWLVVLAAIVCLSSTLATSFLYNKIPGRRGWRRLAWLGLCGVVAGSGIWTTHFVGMLAYKTGLPTAYEPIATFGSLLIAVAGTAIGIAVATSSRTALSRGGRAAIGGFLFGVSITAMHYAGMAGYLTEGHLVWDYRYVGASAFIGAVVASSALTILSRRSDWRLDLTASLVLCLAIVGMHFTGMAAVTLVPDPTVLVPHAALTETAMIVSSVGMTAVILLTALIGVAFERARADGTLHRLQMTLNAMPEGVAYYDADDRLMAWNAQYAMLATLRGAPPVMAMTFESMVRTTLQAGGYVDAVGREDVWLAERLARRAKGDSSIVMRMNEGRTFRVSDTRTADGGIVSVCVDITELVAAEEAAARARDEAQTMAARAEAAEETAGMGHWRVDARTKTPTWSAQLYRLYGLNPDEALDLGSLMKMTHPDDAAESAARLEHQFRTGASAERSVTRIIRGTGETRFLAGRSRAEFGPNGEVVALIGTVIDVTEVELARQALVQSEERFRRLAMNAPDMIAESDLAGVMSYVSPACLTITGFTQEELTGRTFASLMEPEDAQQVLRMCQTVFNSKGQVAPWPVEFRARHKDGHEIWLECCPTLVRDTESGQFVGLTDVIRDITARKQLEADLRQAQADAEAAAAVKAEFLANMSHELRTPLTSIIGFTGLAADQPELSDLSRNYVGRVRDASQALLSTVNDILDFSKLEAGQVSIHPQPVELDKLLAACLDLFAPQAGAKDLDLRLAVDPSAKGLVLMLDPDRIRQILLNLVGNAVKFTPAGSVTLHARYRKKSGELEVRIEDTGEGVPQDKLSRLFQRFSQVDGSLTRSAGGTGLGLAICKGLVEAMGGQIGVDSRVGKGSTFWFRMQSPSAKAAAVSAPAGAVPRHAMEGLRVLVADDHPVNRELVRLYLAGIGAEVREAADGEQAVGEAQSWPFDVILMDLRMPHLDGLGALRAIRQPGELNDLTPVLAFTADATATLEAELVASGFDGLVAKPVQPETLIAMVAKATSFELETDSVRCSDAA